MDQPESTSEVARAMRQIDLEQEAADRALHGFAIPRGTISSMHECSARENTCCA